jgi:diguanylate cyclase (GGDEF)-like protein
LDTLRAAIGDNRAGQLALAHVVASLEYHQAQAKRLETLATVDELTGLPNRRALMSRAQELGRGQRVVGQEERSGEPRAYATVLFDLDKFKPINDELGHVQGDRALQMAALALRASVRHSRDGVFRLGGDEFALLMPIMEEEARLVLPRIVHARFTANMKKISNREGADFLPRIFLDQVTRLDEQVAGMLGASCGASVSEGPYIGDFAAELRRADLALYEAKDQGRDRAVVYDPLANPDTGRPFRNI